MSHERGISIGLKTGGAANSRPPQAGPGRGRHHARKGPSDASWQACERLVAVRATIAASPVQRTCARSMRGPEGGAHPWMRAQGGAHAAWRGAGAKPWKPSHGGGQVPSHGSQVGAQSPRPSHPDDPAALRALMLRHRTKAALRALMLRHRTKAALRALMLRPRTKAALRALMLRPRAQAATPAHTHH